MSTSDAMQSLLETKVDFSLMHGDVPIALYNDATYQKFKSISDKLQALEPKLRQVATQLPPSARQYLEMILVHNFSDLKRTAAETANLWALRPSGNHRDKYLTEEVWDSVVKQHIASLKSGLGNWNGIVSQVRHLAGVVD